MFLHIQFYIRDFVLCYRNSLQQPELSKCCWCVNNVTIVFSHVSWYCSIILSHVLSFSPSRRETESLPQLPGWTGHHRGHCSGRVCLSVCLSVTVVYVVWHMVTWCRDFTLKHSSSSELAVNTVLQMCMLLLKMLLPWHRPLTLSSSSKWLLSELED